MLINKFFRLKIKIHLLVFISFMSLSSLHVFANQLIPVENSSIITSASTTDLLQISSPNAADISINEFSTFDINNRGIKIINSAMFNGLQNNVADSVVIKLDNTNQTLKLKGEVSLVGKPADVIFLVPENGGIECDGCSFKNIPRVVFATGLLHLAENQAIDSIQVRAGSIQIASGGLQAPGISYLDLLSQNISINGNISTNLKAVKNGENYTIDPNGNIAVASGSIQILLGLMQYNFNSANVHVPQTDMLNFVLLNQQEATFFAANNINIKSGSVNIENLASAGETRIDQAINAGAESTISQLTIYKGQPVIPDNKITINTFNKLSIGGDLQAANSISLKTMKDLYLENTLGFVQPQIMAPEIQVVSANSLYNYGDVDGKHVELAALNIINEGFLQGTESLYLSGETLIKNQFGGEILAKDAKFETGAHGQVVIGSKWPFDTIYSQQTTTDMPMKQASQITDVVLFESGQYSDFADEDNLLRINKTTSEAKVIALNIQVNTGELKVINPYYELHNGVDALPALNPMWTDAVLLGAEQKIIINAAKKVINSSAIIETATDNLVINSPYIENDRYRVVVNSRPGSDLEPNMCAQTKACASYHQTWSSVQYDITDEYLHYFSPPGRIYSGRDVLFKDVSHLVNRFSFIEVANDLHAKVNNVEQIGLSLQQHAIETSGTRHRRSKCRRKIFGKCSGRYYVHWWTYSEKLYQAITGELPALTLVEGYLRGEGSDKFAVYTIKFDANGEITTTNTASEGVLP